MQDETTYKLLKIIENEPHLSQREIAKRMDVSLGKANYCLKALTDRGLIKIRNFYKNKKKSPYIYFLTPQGIEEKAQVTYRFLQIKMKEYEDIKEEIKKLKSEAIIVNNIKPKDSEID